MFDAKTGMPLDTFNALRQAGKDAGIADPDILVGLAHAENGPKGFELGYGVGFGRSESNPFYGVDKQMHGAAHQIKLTEQRFAKDTKSAPTDSAGHYTQDFLKYFSSGGQSLGIVKPSYGGYAPLNANDTDPNGKNANHFGNLANKYFGMKRGK